MTFFPKVSGDFMLYFFHFSSYSMLTSFIVRNKFFYLSILFVIK